MKERSFGLFLTAALGAGLLSSPALALEPTRTMFDDVPAGEWYATGAAVCANEGIMIGDDNGLFRPEDRLTQAECVLLTVRLDRLQKGLEGPLPAAPEGWGTVVITDEAGETAFTWEDYQGYSMGGGSYTICLPPEKTAPLEGTTGRLILNGTRTFEGAFTMGTDADQPRAGLVFQKGGQSSYDDFDAILDGFGLAEALSTVPDWAVDGLYYVAENGLDLGYLGCDLSPATRLGFLTALEGVADPREMEARNTVEALPDIPVDSYMTWTDDGRSGTCGNIGDFYRAGILSGTDPYGTFNGDWPLTRGEAATMLARILRPELRLSFTLTPYPWETGYELTDLGLSSKDWWNSDISWIFPDTAESPLDQQVLRVSRREDGGIDYDQDGIFTMEGGWLVEPGRYGEIGSFGPDGLALVATTHSMGTARYGAIDSQGREVLAPVYDGACLGGDGIIAAYSREENAYLLFDAQGEPAGQLSAAGIQIWGIREGLALYQEEDSQLWGYLDLEGQAVIPARFEMAGLFYDGLAAVVLEGKTGYIGHDGQLVIPCQFKAIGSYDQGHFQDGAAIVTDSEGYALVIDKAGKQLSPHRYDLLDDGFSPNGLAHYQLWTGLEEGPLEGFVDTQGMERPMPAYSEPYQIMACSGGYYLVLWDLGGVYNYMDGQGRLLSPTWSREASPLTEDGRAIVLRGDRYYRLQLK